MLFIHIIQKSVLYQLCMTEHNSCRSKSVQSQIPIRIASVNSRTNDQRAGITRRNDERRKCMSCVPNEKSHFAVGIRWREANSI